MRMMNRLFCILFPLLLALPAQAAEIKRGDWTGADDCRTANGDCFAQTLHVDEDFGQYRAVVRFVIGKLNQSDNFQAGFEAAMVPKEGDVKAVVRKVIFHSDGPPQSFKSVNVRTNEQGLTYTETFSLFRDGDPAIVDLIDYLKGAESLRITLVIEREATLVKRDVTISLKGSSHVLKRAFGTIERKVPEYGDLLSLDILQGFPAGSIKSCVPISGLAAAVAGADGNLECEDLAEFKAGDSKLRYRLASAERDALVFLRIDSNTYRTVSGDLACDILLEDTPTVVSEGEGFFYLKTAERCGGHLIVAKLPKPGGAAVTLTGGLARSDAFRALAAGIYGSAATADPLFR